MTTWSFSRLKSFETCPKQFYHVTVLGEYPVVQTDAMTYGTAMHKAAEDYIGENKPLPDEFMYVKGTLDELLGIQGYEVNRAKIRTYQRPETLWIQRQRCLVPWYCRSRHRRYVGGASMDCRLQDR